MSPRAFCRRVTSLGTVALSLCVSHWCVLASVRQREGHRLGTASSIGRLAVDHSSTSNQIASAPPHLPLSLSSLCVGPVCRVSVPHPPPPPTSCWAPHWPLIFSAHLLCYPNRAPSPPILKKKKKKEGPLSLGAGELCLCFSSVSCGSLQLMCHQQSQPLSHWCHGVSYCLRVYQASRWSNWASDSGYQSVGARGNWGGNHKTN